MELIEYLKVMTKEQDENLLKAIIDDSKDFIKGYINSDEIPPKLDYLVKKISVINYNRLGIEGMKSYSEGGTSQSIDELNKQDLSVLASCRKFTLKDFNL